MSETDATDVERLRDFLCSGYCVNPDAADRPDEELQAVIDGAKKWIAGRRWSWKIVAVNYLRDGRFHAGRYREAKELERLVALHLQDKSATLSAADKQTGKKPERQVDGK